MRLLILTQKVDKNDPVLGFFHAWVSAFAQKTERITVVCLEKGQYSLPQNVEVFSLGKEEGRSKIKYLFRFVRYIVRNRKEYDSVFVHMNQEYVLLGGVIWGLLGKHIFLWRNHPAGNIFTRLAVILCDKTFCTSQFSYINRFKKNELMPVGVDTDFFVDRGVERTKDILFLGRIAPIKHPDFLISALAVLKKKGIHFRASFVGNPSPKDTLYYEKLKKEVAGLSLSCEVSFYQGVPNHDAVNVYNEHRIFVNLSPSGLYDKTIFEAFASGALCLSSNENLKGKIDPRLFFKENILEDLVGKIEALLALSKEEKLLLQKQTRDYTIQNHSLTALVGKLFPALLIAEKKRPFFGTILKYLFSGGTAAFVDLLFLHIFTDVLRVWYLFSTVLAFLVAFGVSFSLQKFWTFQDGQTDGMRGQMALYFLITSINLGWNTLLMYVMVDFVHLHYLLAQFIANGLVALQSFFVYQKFVFKKK